MRPGEHAREIIGQRADVLRNRHVVVVEDDQQVGRQRTGVVQRLERHAGGQRAVADDRHRRAGRSPRCAAATAMPRAALIEVLECPTPKVSYSLSLRGREGRQAAVLLDGVQPIAPPGQHLVRIGLMAHVPHQRSSRRVEDVVQRDGQLHGAQAGGEVAAAGADGLDQEFAAARRPERGSSRSGSARRSAGDSMAPSKG